MRDQRTRPAVITGTLVSALLLAGASARREQRLADRTDPAPGGRPNLTSRAPEPRLFGEGVISTADYEFNASFTADGKSVYFTKSVPNLNTFFFTIVVSRFVNGRWTTPEVAPFSGQWSDLDPFVSPDGSKLFFLSNRPVQGSEPRKDFDIWVVARAGADWGVPTNLGPPVNSDANEWYPSVDREGTLYFGARRPDSRGSVDLYRAKFANGKYGAPENLGDSVNSRFEEGDPFIAADGSYLIWTSYGRPEGLGNGDLYISYKRNGVWSQAVNMGGPVNSPALDFCPIVSPDGKTLYFASERGFGDARYQVRRLTYRELVAKLRGPRNGLGDIYEVDLIRP